MKKPAVFMILLLVLVCGGLRAQTTVWQPSPGHTQNRIWPGVVPDAQPVPGPESATTTKTLYAGKPAVVVTNVSQPTMTVYSPKGKNTGAAVVVFPGGGYNILALATIGPASKPAVERLIVALDDEEWKVRKHAVEALPLARQPNRFSLPSDRLPRMKRIRFATLPPRPPKN